MKRKANKELLKTHKVRKSEIASIVTPIVPNGDLQLDFSKDLAQPLGLLVSRYILCVASPVFNAMLGDDSHFSESTSKVLNADGVQVVRLDDDSYTAMEIMMNVVHLQGNEVPKTLLFPQLDLCAGLCDKYDMAKSLGRWPDIWMEQYLTKVEHPGYERWLFISSIFEQKGAHAAITRHIVLNATMSDTGELLYRNCSRFSEGVAASILEWIRETRFDVSCKLLMLCWHAMCRLQGQAACTLRRFSRVDEAEDCEAVNRGCLTREFPDARYPKRASGIDSRSIVEIHDAIKRIRHLDAMNGLDAWFASQHRACDVGYSIQAKADACVKEVVGRRLKYRRFESPTPTWFDSLVTELRTSYPHANLEALMRDVIVDALADSVSVRNIAHEGLPATTVTASMPTLACIDCSDVWMFPGPEKIGNQIEDHMKSTKHLERVQTRLDMAWQAENGEENDIGGRQ